MNYKDFNTLPLEELVKLKGIGKVTAQRIIERRSMFAFKSNSDLMKVRGIGQKTLDKIGIESDSKNTFEAPAKTMDLTSGFAQDCVTGVVDYFWNIESDRRMYFYTPAKFMTLGIENTGNVIFVN